MNNKNLDLYLKFIFDYIQKYIILQKDLENSIKDRNYIVKKIRILNDFIYSNTDIDIQQRLIISNLIDSIDNSSKIDRKVATYLIQTIEKQNVTRKKNLLEKLKLGLERESDFILHNDSSFYENYFLCKKNNKDCSKRNCSVYMTDKEYNENFEGCKERKRHTRELHLKDQKYCKLNHTHRILTDIPKDENQNFLSINIYPSITPEQANNPFKVCSIQNCICCSIKYMNEKNCSIESLDNEELYRELTSEDLDKQCKYMKIYEAQEDKKIKLSNRLESIIEDVEVLESKLNRIENIVKELKKIIEK